MRFIRVLVALACASILAPAGAGATQPETNGKLASIEAVAISPTGQSLAYVVTDGEQRMVLVKDMATGKFTIRAPAGSANIRSVQWADDLHLLVIAAATAPSQRPDLAPRGEDLFAFTLDVAKRRLKPLLLGAGREVVAIVAIPVIRTVNGEAVAYVQGVYSVAGARRRSLFRVDLDTSASKVIETSAADAVNWTVDANGEPVAQELYDGRTGAWTLRIRTNGGWRDAERITAKRDPPHVIGLGRDGRSVLYAVYDAARGGSWREARTDGAPSGEPLKVTLGQEPIVDSTNGRLIGVCSPVGDARGYSFFEETDNKGWNAVTTAFPNSHVTLASSSADHQRLVVLVESPSERPAYALVDLRTRNASWLGARHGALMAPEALCGETATLHRCCPGLSFIKAAPGHPPR